MDIRNLHLIRYSKNYKIKYETDDLILCAPECTIPFGTEKYNGKLIVNLEFLDNNDFINSIKAIENAFSNIKNENYIQVPNDLLDDIKSCNFISSVKDRSIVNNKKFHLRCHVKKEILYEKLKSVEIKLDHLWINKNNSSDYGLCWVIHNYELN